MLKFHKKNTRSNKKHAVIQQNLKTNHEEINKKSTC
jgi:hypothetical protein